MDNLPVKMQHSKPISKHLLVAVSSHGFGHLSQVAPAVNTLKRHLPDLKITVRGAFDRARILSRLPVVDIIETVADDFGMVMTNAVTVDVAASVNALASFHHDWDRRVALLAEHLVSSKVDLVLADVPYLTLAAAARAGIPAVALSSLNWADIFEDSLGSQLDSDRLEQIRAYYQSARYFLQCAPSMPMPWLHNRRAIGPVCSPGKPLRDELIRALDVASDAWLVLVSMGGLPLDLSLAAWPQHLEGRAVYFLAPAQLCHTHPQAISVDALTMPYGDIIASVDLVITKPGYGMFAEAACSGRPVIYVERNDWAETTALTQWLESRAHCKCVSYAQLNSAAITEVMRTLLLQGPYPPVAATGNEEAALLIKEVLAITG